MQRIRMFTIAVFSCVTVGAALAQDADLLQQALSTRPDPSTPVGENFEVPLGWNVRLDKPDESVQVGSDKEGDVYFVSMTPGWHLTTRPRAIFYHPASTAEGSYRARAAIYLFPPGERNEGFGLFVGGQDLEADDQKYLYFLVRRSGEFLIKTRAGDETSVVHPWTASDAIIPYTDTTEGTVHNVLEIQSTTDRLTFMVNSTEVASVPRADLPADGIVGLRVNHGLNLHIDDFSVEDLD